MKVSADIVVLSPDNQVQLIVEVKSIKGTTDDWAAKMRRNLMTHALIPKSKFFLLALPGSLYLWRNITSADAVQADYKVRAVEVLEPYVGDIPLEQLSENSLELVLRSWLSNLVSSNLTRETAGPGLRWVFDSGLYETIQHGSIETAVAV